LLDGQPGVCRLHGLRIRALGPSRHDASCRDLRLGVEQGQLEFAGIDCHRPQILWHIERHPDVLAQCAGEQAAGQMDVVGRTFDRYAWPLATGYDTRLQPLSTKL
jgi:hypothetical protein